MDKLQKDYILSELQSEIAMMSSYSDLISKILNNLDNHKTVQNTALELAADHLRRMKYLKEKYKQTLLISTIEL